MADTLNISIPAGTDGEVPIRNPDGRTAFYALKDLWDNTIGSGRFIPNVGDIVADTESVTTSAWWKVQALDVDYKSVLVPWNNIPSNTIDQADILTGPGRLTHNSTYRAYIDKSVTPYVLVVDNRLSFKSTISRFVKIFKQEDGPADLKVISNFYGPTGDIISQSIPLQLVGVDAQTNKSEYAVPECYTMEDLPNGEMLTVVAYTEQGHPSSINQCLVVNSSFIRHRNDSVRYVKDIELLSPFMSETDPSLIQLPINVPLQALYLTAKVHYSDNSFREYPVDGTHFTLLGMESYLATMVNQKITVFLRYTPTKDEEVYGATRGEQIFVTKPYTIKTMEAKGAYNVRLYCYPEWVGELNGYHLRWFLHTAERNARYDVTEHVQYTVNTPGFQPKLYGVNQLLNVSINLKDINPLYENFRHAQTVQIVLWRDATERQTNWTVVFEQGQDPAYGLNSFAHLEFINQNYYKINLASGCLTVNEWLDKVYKPMHPLFDSRKEMEAPAPTHFRIRVGNSEVVEKPLSQWNQTFAILNGLEESKNVYIEWIRKTPETDLELGTSGLVLYGTGGVPL